MYYLFSCGLLKGALSNAERAASNNHIIV